MADLASHKISVIESKGNLQSNNTSSFLSFNYPFPFWILLIVVSFISAYHMEKLQEPGVPVPLDSKLLNFDNFVFRLVFEEGE